MGPRCRFASTVEIAYHLRPLTGASAPTKRVILPEPSLWEPQTPHLYSGPIELWQNGQRVDVVDVCHGLRQFTIGPRGLTVNGRLMTLRGRYVETLTDAEALALREAGINLLVVPVGDGSRHVWAIADHVGFLVLGRYQTVLSEMVLEDLASHACHLGWLDAGGECHIDGNEVRTESARIGVIEG
jgi:hypothetical protein